MYQEVSLQSYASLSRRALAATLDAFILCSLGFFTYHIVPYVGGLVGWFFYAPIFESSEIRATLGKHLAGIQVTDLMGKRLSLRAAMIRNVVKFFASVLLFIGFLIALFTRKKQTLHDLLADTVVVYGRSEHPIGDAWLSNVKALFRTESAAWTNPSRSVLSDLERLQTLREKGVLSEEEFQKQKSEILSKGTNPT